MGTSFRNIQVYNPGHNNHYDVDEAFCVEHLAPDSVRLIEALDRVPIGAYYVVEGAEDYYKFRDLNETLSEISEL